MSCANQKGLLLLFITYQCSFWIVLKGGVFINSKPRFFVGVDSHKFLHTATVINIDTDKLLTFTFKNEPQFFDNALSKIIKVTKCKDVIFGLEDTASFGLHFSYYLIKFGFEVKSVDPTLASAYRSTLSNYHKSDEYDSFCVAKVLKDDYKHLPSFKYELIYSNIKLLVGIREQVVKHQSSDYLILHQQLAKVYPGYTKFFSNLKKRSALAFFKQYPAPRHLKGYNAETLRKEMLNYTRKFPVVRADKILTTVRNNPIPFIDEIVEGIIVELIKDIYNKEERLVTIEKQLEVAVEKSGYKLHSMPSIGIVTAAKIISEIGDINRFKNHHTLARYAGIAPTSVGSGGKNKELVSHGGNRELRSIFFYLSVGLILVTRYGKSRNEGIREYYLKKVSEGKTNTQALVLVMRWLVKVIYSMMKSKKEYVEMRISEEKKETSITKEQ